MLTLNQNLYQHRSTIERGDMLCDMLINGAMSIIQLQCPQMGGLYNTLLPQLMTSSTQPTVQIHFCRESGHWVTSANISGDITLYDSVHSPQRIAEPFLNHQLSNLYGKGTSVLMPQLEQQKGGRDCGVYAIAYLTSLVWGDDTCSFIYTQCELRRHRIASMEK